jgi:hypothetical protein
MLPDAVAPLATVVPLPLAAKEPDSVVPLGALVPLAAACDPEGSPVPVLPPVEDPVPSATFPVLA